MNEYRLRKRNALSVAPSEIIITVAARLQLVNAMNFLQKMRTGQIVAVAY
jgi:hypothetical protein